MKLARHDGMKEYAAGIQSTDLRLLDVPAPARRDAPADDADVLPLSSRNADGTLAPPSGNAGRDTPAASGAATAQGDGTPPDGRPEASVAAAGPASESATADKFLTAATKEFEAGIIDQPLWRRAAAQSGDDRTLTAQNYLRARAIALRVAKREKREERSARRARAMTELAQPEGARGGAVHGEQSPQAFGVARPATRPKRRQALWIGGALASLFVAALLATVRFENGSAPQRSAAKAASAASAAKRAGAAATQTDGVSGSALSGDNFVAKIPGLKSAGNWNMVVLYAVEWTRKQPDNPAAWKELATGYAKLRQYREALEAATRVVQITPDDAEAWRSVGQLNVILQQPADALAAFEQAIARNERDASSIVQTGLLNTQLGRLADAQAAFDRALALDGHDVDALCGAAALARKDGRTKDAEALARQVAALDGRCRDPAPGESVRVAAGATSPTFSSPVR
jgi:tetratricopeptide (TPR) repeat protein